MPQLNPGPWFAIMLFTWLMLLISIPTKILSRIFTNKLNSQDSEKPKGMPWTWPWH
uniref:ATP synthase complex subunit 8 n=1 Tax=Epinnula magistralis TaxID=1262608 RepID=T2HU49_9SCOM|nr:ATP synthase F0 subunit 8 [Epinnula magistralis]BAN83741.1 ATPase subunit 8 [Epinnula magistralis]